MLEFSGLISGLNQGVGGAAILGHCGRWETRCRWETRSLPLGNKKNLDEGADALAQQHILERLREILLRPKLPHWQNPFQWRYRLLVLLHRKQSSLASGKSTLLALQKIQRTTGTLQWIEKPTERWKATPL
ncbi:hypothetical protein JTB14_027046 [Gonioctena quinquepunctata]|nr:hypothetical protein JTB14_027046 [Gonioctena quinquepunctata]